MQTEISQALSLEGRVAVITGAASGIGRGTALLFAKAGAQVVLADVDMAGLEETASQIGNAGARALIRTADVTDRAAVDALADTTVRDTGKLDIWINCAGIARSAQVVDVVSAEAERVIAINMMGTYWGCSAAGRVMQAQGRGGVILNISSTAGESPVAGMSAYCMTKAAVNQLTRVCAVEFGAAGIRVNAVVPGFVDTPINAGMYRDERGEIDPARHATLLEELRSVTPLGMTGEPNDIAFALLYLASDASRYVTGHLLRVSGGI